nr:hypothetical protein [Thauera phenolivorans]
MAALLTCASDELKAIYLEKMISGEWTRHDEPDGAECGFRSGPDPQPRRAEPQADGSYRVFGQKIFITYGDHDMTDNIVHLVLARLPDAPAGVKSGRPPHADADEVARRSLPRRHVLHRGAARPCARRHRSEAKEA